MISQDDAEKAVDWLIHSSAEYATARATQEMKQNMLRVTKAGLMKASDEKAIGSQEVQAYASEEYKQSILELFTATLEYEKLRSLREAAKLKCELWRSINADQRKAVR